LETNLSNISLWTRARPAPRRAWDGHTATELEIPSQPIPAGVQPSADWRIVTPGYFATMGIALRGRDFSDADPPDAGPFIIVSESLARRHWPNDDAIGKRIITRSLDNQARTIIGVANDVRSVGLDTEPGPMLYYSGVAIPAWSSMYLVWRSTVDPQSQVPAIRAAVGRLHPQMAFYDVTRATDLLADSFGPRRFNLYLLGLFASVALALSAIGLFGVMAYLVAQRAREIGVGLALGATRRDVVRLVVWRGLALALAGSVLGAGGAWWLTRLMEGLLFAVSATDPMTFVAVPLAVILLALIACYVPARRALKIDPVTALRAE
jgi:predicted permease